MLQDNPTIRSKDDGLHKRVGISFSGGRTSAVMTHKMLSYFRTQTKWKVITKIVFSNTGCEHEETYKFIEKCQTFFDHPIDWVEPTYNPKMGIGPRATLVDYKSANREGKPFEDFIKKHGIPNSAFPACSASLKRDTILNYFKEHVGWVKGTYTIAIGIRADEADRISIHRKKNKITYPLIQLGMDTAAVLKEYESWPISLNLPNELYGNCIWCWKKPKRKLLTLAKNDPQVFDFPKQMEAKYSTVNMRIGYPRYFYRDAESTHTILQHAQEGAFTEWKPGLPVYQDELDRGGGCGESCEIFTESDDKDFT